MHSCSLFFGLMRSFHASKKDTVRSDIGSFVSFEFYDVLPVFNGGRRAKVRFVHVVMFNLRSSSMFGIGDDDDFSNKHVMT